MLNQNKVVRDLETQWQGRQISSASIVDANRFGEGKQMTSKSIRVEPIDNRHPLWGDVLGSIYRSGNQHSLMLGEDGWLSTRQTVLAAFDGPNVVGHLCFRVEPARSAQGNMMLRSRVDSFAVQTEYGDQPVEKLLMQTAELRAGMMRCPPPRMELIAI